MRTKVLLAALIGSTVLAPATASAATSCVDVFEMCLNDSWNTSGLTRYLANLECSARYAGCLRKVIM